MNVAEYACGALSVPANIQGLKLDDELVGFPSLSVPQVCARESTELAS